MTLPAYEPTGLALELFKDRYALHPEESFSQACRRVADYIAGAEEGSKREEFAERFYDIMVQNRFSPGGRIWRGSGRPRGQLLNCFSLTDSIDSREGWGDTLRNVTIISGVGGGVGINFSQVRPRGSKIAGTGGEATGSVSLMRAVNAVCNELREGGNRRSALLFALRYDHPDIMEFLSAKLDLNQLNNANISVLIDDEFLRLVDEDQEIVFRWQGQERGRVPARDIWNKIVENAWKSAEPGLLNWGLVERRNTIGYRTKLVTVNPCFTGEMRLHTSEGMVRMADMARLAIPVCVTTDARIAPDGIRSCAGTVLRRASEVRMTARHQAVYRLVTSHGHELRCTEYHQFPTPDGRKELRELKPGDVLLLQSGEGAWGSIGSYEDGLLLGGSAAEECVPECIWQGSRDMVRGYLSALFAGDGTVCYGDRGSKSDFSVRLNQSNKSLLLDVQRLLSNFGIVSLLYHRRAAGRGAESYELTISCSNSLVFWRSVGFVGEKQQRLTRALDHRGTACRKPERFITRVVAIEPDGVEDVYCLTEPQTHSIVVNGVVTAQCGEVPMSPFEACDLGSINLAAHVVDGKIDWDLLDGTIRLAVRFLDNVLDRNHYPLPKIEETCRTYRRIGLGVMGLHDMLLELGIRYSSDEALRVIDEVMGFIKERAYEASIKLAIEKGPFPVIEREAHIQTGFARECLTPKIRAMIREHGIRNCAVLALAPTGTISIVAGVSSGIEPMFAPVYERRFNIHRAMHDMEREQGVEIVVHPLVRTFIEQGRSVEHFEGAHEIAPDQHGLVQQVCQRHVDQASSKTVNLPADFPVEQLGAFLRRHITHLKGLTVYRDGCRGQSPLVPVPMAEASRHLDSIRARAAVQECATGACSL